MTANHIVTIGLDVGYGDTKAIAAGSITWQYHPIIGAWDLLLT